jgi:hypothetical protein
MYIYCDRKISQKHGGSHGNGGSNHGRRHKRRSKRKTRIQEVRELNAANIRKSAQIARLEDKLRGGR